MRVILVVCRAPGGCARAAGIRVMGVWGAAHQLRAHSRRAQVLVCPGEKTHTRFQRAKVMMQVGEYVDGESSTLRTWGPQHLRNRGRAGDTERGTEVIVCRVPHVEIEEKYLKIKERV